ncbi:S-adenosyl-L-methionine-dependent tRNA 4-demethylwyosine synthase [Arachis hypogaea]|nr:S-adenosyl-L-methionine-dependent tRNA 4-demethylwyosine synthase [Arachis hypogaea]
MPLWLPSLPADVSVSAILSSVAAATVTAASFFLIYKSHLRPHKENLITLHQEQPKRNPRGKILFVSRIGFSTAEAVAKRLCDLLESKGLVLEVVDARTYDPEDLPKENLILLLHSTSHNQPPLPFADNSNGARDFTRWLVDNAESFGIGAVVVKACSFTAFVVGKRDGKNLMAKAANHFRDLDHVKYDHHFEERWGSIVATVSGEVANGMCRESEPEDDAGCCDPKRIYMLVENLYDGFRSRTYRRRMLTISEANFMKNGTVDLEDGGPVTVKWPLPHGGTSDSSLPLSEKFCCSVGLSLFFLGDWDEDIERELHFDGARNIWCLKYDGKCPACVNPHSYFLWETLIVLYSFDDVNQWLMSYDLNANIWSPIECNFPPFCDYKAGRKLVHLGCSDFLLIIDIVSIWCIYDLSKKKPVAVVHVNDLDEMGMVSNVFCCHHTSKESLIYVFTSTDQMDIKRDIERPNQYINIVPYARVKLQTEGNFSAKVESKGNLKVSPHLKYYVFAAVDQDIKGKTTVA